MKTLAIILIRTYQITISPLFKAIGGRCIYKMSCSEFAVHAFTNYRFFPALSLSLKRFLSCNPITAYRKK